MALATLGSHLRRAGRYTGEALSVATAGPPWHRGLCSTANIVFSIGLAHQFLGDTAALVAAALALFFSLADSTGPIRQRLATLGWCTLFISIAALCAMAVGERILAFSALFLVLVFVTGVASFAGAPFFQATRFSVVVGLLLVGSRALSLEDLLLAIGLAASVAALTRSVESLIAPDTVVSEYATLKQAYYKIRAARPILLRYAVCYTLAGTIAWVVGRSVDSVHPTWITVSTLVVMWPDATRSYQRVLQRVFGTLAGGLLAMALIHLFHGSKVLPAVAIMLAFFLPHFVRRNYWMHSGLMVIFVLLSLDISSDVDFSMAVIGERIGDVLLGCVLAMLGTLAAFYGVRRRIALARANAVRAARAQTAQGDTSKT